MILSQEERITKGQNSQDPLSISEIPVVSENLLLEEWVVLEVDDVLHVRHADLRDQVIVKETLVLGRADLREQGASLGRIMRLWVVVW